MQVRGERAEDGEPFVQGRVLFHQLVNVLGHVLLLHHEDEVLLVGFQDDGEQKQCGGLLVGDSAIAEHVRFLIDKEVAAREHE